MMLESNGWLLTLRSRWRAAVGLRELVHVLPYSPRLYMVPQTPAHARHVILWEGRIVPVADLVAYLEAGAERGLRSATDRPSLDQLVGIIAYQAAPGSEVSLAGMLLDEVPERIRVTDEQACALPESPACWYQVAISCFEHPDYGAVPILDLPRLFSGRVPVPAATTPVPQPDPRPSRRGERLEGVPALREVTDQSVGALPQRATLTGGGM
jgi:chemotaxis signal transduction protein